jgi:hypothetical protein
MGIELDPSERVTFKELLMSEVIQSETLINLSDHKSIIKKRTPGGDEKGSSIIAWS